MSAPVPTDQALPDTIEQRVETGGRELTIVRPRDYDAMLTEEAFDDERLLPYWAQVWDSALLLGDCAAAAVMTPRMRVLELGCGLGVPSIAAALAGAEVTATDWSQESVRATAANAQRNGARLRTEIVDWRSPEQLLAGAPWDLVLASDIVYEAKQIPVLLDLLPRLAALVLLAEPGRAVAEPFFEPLGERWTVTEAASWTEPRAVVHRLQAR